MREILDQRDKIKNAPKEAKNKQEAQNIVENTSLDDEVSFAQEATTTNSFNEEEINHDLKEFGVDSEAPDLFNLENESPVGICRQFTDTCTLKVLVSIRASTVHVGTTNLISI